jgi:hypothetical protein
MGNVHTPPYAIEDLEQAGAVDVNIATKRFLSTAGCGAALIAGVLAAVGSYPEQSASTADPSTPTIETGVTVSQTTAPSSPTVPSAAPSITGPAPLPAEEQDLPG